jgi:rod shape-determining protein MreC
LQIDFARQGRTSPLTQAVTTVTTYAQLAVSSIIDGVHGGFTAVVDTPQLAHDNAALRDENEALRADNQRLTEALARVPAERDLALAQIEHPTGIPATVIGYDPEATMHIVTVDKGSKDGVQRDAGVVTAEGVVGRVTEVSLLSSKVLLVNDVTSKLPAIVQRGRWWAIAVGTQTRIKLEYVSQDAKLKVGDAVITGEGRSFHAGIVIGHIAELEPAAAGALDQSALVEPAVQFGSLSRVLILPR